MQGQQAGGCIGGSIGLNIPLGSSASINPKLADDYCEKVGTFYKSEIQKHRQSFLFSTIMYSAVLSVFFSSFQMQKAPPAQV